MNRVEFMERLRVLLGDIPAEEREEALEYYRGYFEDAGEAEEERIIKELGSPERVAETIRAGLDERTEHMGEYGETGYRDTRFEQKEVPSGYRKTSWGKGNSTAVKILLILLILLIGIPVVIPAAAGILAGAVGLLIGFAALLAGFLLGGIAIIIAGIALMIEGLSQLYYSMPIALGMTGGGLLTVAFGMMFTAFFWWIFLKTIPRIVSWAVRVVSSLFHRRGGEAR